jgi:eukaryotic translation initiation factor 2C
MKDRSKNPPTERDISVYDYFKEKYSIRLEFPHLPLVQTTRDGVFPMEICMLKPNQKYVYKLDSQQVNLPYFSTSYDIVIDSILDFCND